MVILPNHSTIYHSFKIMLQQLYQFQVMNQRDESLLSSLSSLSDCGIRDNLFPNDFFSKSGQKFIPFKGLENQEEVKISDLEPCSGKNIDHPNHYLQSLVMTDCWMNNKNYEDGQSQNDCGYASERDEDQLPIIPSNIEMLKLSKLTPVKKDSMTPEQEEGQNQESGTILNSPTPSDHHKIVKNQTKNIPKNYGKAIITFIQKQKNILQPIIEDFGLTYEEFLEEINNRKKGINTIANLRDLWIDFEHAKCFRVISSQFLRKHALNYIFNSRISNYRSHVKYRKRLQEAVQAPELFKHIKQY